MGGKGVEVRCLVGRNDACRGLLVVEEVELGRKAIWESILLVLKPAPLTIAPNENTLFAHIRRRLCPSLRFSVRKL